jgi:predicted DNA-binding transcriptional regulator YafY
MLKTERLLAIIFLLQARGKQTAHQIAGILAVSPRTIYRDMDALSLAHVPVSMDHGPGGGYFLPADYRLNPAIFTPREALALALGAAMTGAAQLFDKEGMRQALFKMEAALPEEYRGEIRSASERVLLDLSGWYQRPSGTEQLQTVRQAVWDGRQVDLLYRRSDRPGGHWRRVEPYGLVCKAGIWYLAAWCHLREDFRTFRLSRMLEVRATDEPVTPRPNFDLPAYWEEARHRFERMTMPVPLTLRLSPHSMVRVEGECTILAEEPTGHAVVRIDLESIEHAASYALSFGSHAEVLDPPEVRQAVSCEAQELVALYAVSPEFSGDWRVRANVFEDVQG